MKLLITLIILFTTLSLNQIAYSATIDQPIKNGIDTQQLTDDTEETEDDDDEC